MEWGVGVGVEDWGVGSGEWGVGSGEWGMGSGEWGVWSGVSKRVQPAQQANISFLSIICHDYVAPICVFRNWQVFAYDSYGEGMTWTVNPLSS